MTSPQYKNDAHTRTQNDVTRHENTPSNVQQKWRHLISKNLLNFKSVLSHKTQCNSNAHYVVYFSISTTQLALLILFNRFTLYQDFHGYPTSEVLNCNISRINETNVVYRKYLIIFFCSQLFLVNGKAHVLRAITIERMKYPFSPYWFLDQSFK